MVFVVAVKPNQEIHNISNHNSVNFSNSPGIVPDRSYILPKRELLAKKELGPKRNHGLKKKPDFNTYPIIVLVRCSNVQRSNSCNTVDKWDQLMSKHNDEPDSAYRDLAACHVQVAA